MEYSYLSDGTRTAALDSDGEGLVYRGPFTYRRSASGALTLEAAACPEGLLTDGEVLLHVTDHLGSTMAVMRGSDGALYEASEYDAYGKRSSLTVSGAAALPDGVTLRSGFTGKEDQAPDFGIGYTDFGARLYSPASRRWMVPDPLSEKYYGISPYAYCAGNPVNLVDKNGMDVYKFNPDGTYVATETYDPYDMLVWGPSGDSVIIRDKSIMSNIRTGYYPYRYSDDSEVVQRSMIYSAFSSHSPDKDLVFRFLTQSGCSVEWISEDHNNGLSIIATQHLSSRVNVSAVRAIARNGNNEIFENDVTSHIHNHPGSFIDKASEIDSMAADMINFRNNIQIKSYVLMSESGNLFKLTENGPVLVEKY